jgi:hypothetical protein
MRKEDFTLCKSPLSFNLNFRSLVTRMGSQSDSVGVTIFILSITRFFGEKRSIYLAISLKINNLQTYDFLS